MLVEKSTLIYNDLSNATALTDLLTKGVNGIRPLVAEYEDGEDFVTYSLQFNGYATKGGRADLVAVVRSWSTNYDKSIAIADQVSNALDASNNYTAYVSAGTHFTEQQIIYTEQTFNIKN